MTDDHGDRTMIEYDPQPPFDSGHPDRATDEIMTRVITYAAHKA